MNMIGIAILLLFAFLGAVALIAIPIRLWQISMGGLLSVLPSLARPQRFAVVLGVIILGLAGLVWCLGLYVIAMVLMDDAPRRIWGGSELGMAFDVLGFLYLLFELLFLPVTWRQFRRSLAILISAAAIAIVMLPFLVYRAGLHTDRRFDVYDMATSLARDMTVAEVHALLEEKRKPSMKIRTGINNGAGTIQVTTSLGWAEYLFLYLYFYDGRLVATHMVGEDSPDDKFPDQPPDILPTDPDVIRLFRGVRS